jgi:hypothetical protein
MKDRKGSPLNEREVRYILDFASEKSLKYLILIKLMLRGAKIEDLIGLSIIDVRDKEWLQIKSNRSKEINIIKNIKEIDEYIKGKSNYEFLFPSIKSKYSPMKKQSVIATLEEYSKQIKICSSKEDFIMTPRRLYATYIYKIYKDTKDIFLISKIMKTSNLNIIKSYLGID